MVADFLDLVAPNFFVFELEPAFLTIVAFLITMVAEPGFRACKWKWLNRFIRLDLPPVFTRGKTEKFGKALCKICL